MNKDQRKFLAQQVTNTYNAQVKELQNKIPQPPSLSNYIIAAVLDGTAKYKSIDHIKSAVADKVKGLTKDSDRLFKSKDSGWRNRRYNGDDDDVATGNILELEAENVFVIPAAYKTELEKYIAARDEIKMQLSQLEAQHKTILMKIQVGSSQSLEKLVQQIDSIADLDLNTVNSQLSLSVSSPKQLK